MRRKGQIIITLLLVPCIAGSVIMASIWNEAKEVVPPALDQKKYHVVLNHDRPSLIEGDSLVSSQHLKTYFNLSQEEQDYPTWLQENLDREILKQTSSQDIYLFNEDVFLKSLAYNNCQQVYCYQKRIPFEQIPGLLWKSLIGIEDRRYLQHSGIDFKSILRAVIVDIKEMKLVQGASTISMQLVRNLFLTTEKSFSRKFKEMIYAVYIESKYTKADILTAYFNEFVWGSLQSTKAKGIFSASILYFDKRPLELTEFEVSILISLLKGPYYYHPIHRLERLKQRTQVVFRDLIDKEFISRSAKKESWDDKQWEKWQKKLITREADKQLLSGVETINNKSEVLEDFESFILINNSRMVLNQIKERVGKKDIATKILISSPFRDGGKNLFSYYSKFERDKETAIKAEKHLVGSILKPIAYSIFERHGKKWEDLVLMEPIVLDLKSGRWSPKEAKKLSIEPITMKEALQKSRNRPVIHLANELGFELLESELLGYIPSLKTPLSEYPAQLLGGIELSVQEVQAAYQKFLISECSEIGVDKEIEDSLIYILGDPKETTLRNVIDRRLKTMRFFGKTGTSNDGLDSWFVFYDGKNLGIIWVGLEGNRQDKSMRVGGATSAFKIFQNYLLERGKLMEELRCHQSLGNV